MRIRKGNKFEITGANSKSVKTVPFDYIWVQILLNSMEGTYFTCFEHKQWTNCNHFLPSKDIELFTPTIGSKKLV